LFIEHTRGGYITDICEQNVTPALILTAQYITVELKVHEEKKIISKQKHHKGA